MSPSTLSLRSASQADIPQIHALAVRIWNAHYPAIIGQQQVDYMLGKMYSPAALAQQMEEGQTFYLVIEDDQAIGYVAINAQGEKAYFLNKFYVDSQKQSKGIGSRVLQMLLAQYPNWETLRLTVNRQNYTAINFYFKNGFVIEKVIDMPIGEGYVMDDFQMIKRKA
ncbi:GNAT family N-acetyltransferase [Cytophagales bacterium LB-30]|uniref:GNAT family N-acetyltransferase n=1 Tax=Shiella aurantiaca TaxID=3058365 RepID=A0ABT8F5Q9_9BACT|nr:GNAT family N-acetyltransferase [Shiella aurantiaca]MDN4165796.1 GNAT family N-acetyltransferase [Shiella aurantiaca]